MNKLFACVLVCIIAFTNADGYGNFLTSKFTLRTLGTTSEYPPSVYESDPNYYTAFLAGKDDAYTITYVSDDIVVIGFESPNSLGDDNTTWLESYNTSTGLPVKVDRVPGIQGMGSEDAVSGPIFGGSGAIAIVGAYDNDGGICGNYTECPPYATQLVYVMEANGTFNHEPVFSIDLSELGDPYYYATTVSYATVTAISNDGRFATYTYPVWTQDPYAIGGQKLGIFAINSHSYNLTSVLTQLYPTDPVTGDVFFPQFTSMQSIGDGKYVVTTSADSYGINLLTGEFNPLSTPAMALLHIYDSNLNTLTLVGSATQPGIMQGSVLSPDLSMLVTFTNAVGTPSVLLNPTTPAVNATDPTKNIRLYRVNLNCEHDENALTYVSGSNVDGAQCWNGAFSPDSSLFAYTCQPGYPLLATVPAVVPNAIVPTVQVPIPGVLTLTLVDRFMDFTMQNWLTTDIIPIALTFSPDGTKIIVSGSDSPNVGGTNLYEVVQNY